MGFGRRTVLDYTQSKLIHLCVMAQNGWGDFPARFFMHTDAERKYAVGAARVRRASRGKNRSPTRLYTDAERKYAVGAARVHGSLFMDRWHRTTCRGNRMVESGCKRSGYGL